MPTPRAQARTHSKGSKALMWLHHDQGVPVKDIAAWLGVFPSAVSRVMSTGQGGDKWLPALIALARSRGLLSAPVQAPATDQTTPREPDTEPQVRCHNCNGHKQPLSHFGATGHISVMEYKQDREEQSHRDSAGKDDHDEDQGISAPQAPAWWQRWIAGPTTTDTSSPAAPAPAPVQTLPAKLAKQDPATLVGLLRHDVPPEHRLRVPIEAEIIQLAEEGRRARQVARLSPPLRAHAIASAEQQMAEQSGYVERRHQRVEQDQALYEGTHVHDVALPSELEPLLLSPTQPARQTGLQTLAERARQFHQSAALQDLQAIRAGPKATW